MRRPRWSLALALCAALAPSACAEGEEDPPAGEVTYDPNGGDPDAAPEPGSVGERGPWHEGDPVPDEEDPPVEDPAGEDPPADGDDDDWGFVPPDEDPPVDDVSDDPDAEPDPEEDPDPQRLTVTECFADKGGDLGPDVDQYGPVVGSHCKGTNHQDIRDVQRLVFLGDSVTAGTPPTPFWEYFSFRLTASLTERFPGLESQNCAQWGARTDDFLIGKNMIADCFPDGGDDRTTLVVMTIGGNDIQNWAKRNLSAEEALVAAVEAAQLLRDAIDWIQEPGRFPNGVYVIFANPFEYTDATGDLSSCPLSAFAGLEGNWIQGAPAVLRFIELFMEIAVDTQTDMIFMLEEFCGHGFHHDDPESQCYQGPEAELWFDLTCMHPNPTGHGVIAGMFEAVVEG